MGVGVPLVTMDRSPDPRITALQAFLTAVGALVIGGAFVFSVSGGEGQSRYQQTLPVVLGTAIGLGLGGVTYVWAARRIEQPTPRPSGRSVIVTSLGAAGAAAIVSQGPVGLKVGVMACCTAWFATIMTLAA